MKEYMSRKAAHADTMLDRDHISAFGGAMGKRRRCSDGSRRKADGILEAEVCFYIFLGPILQHLPEKRKERAISYYVGV
jgi:hypothetical protein